VGYELVPSLLGRCKQKQRGLTGLLCRWPSITEWEMHFTVQGPCLRNDLYCVEWDIKLYYAIPYHTFDNREVCDPAQLFIYSFISLCMCTITQRIRWWIVMMGWSSAC